LAGAKSTDSREIEVPRLASLAEIRRIFVLHVALSLAAALLANGSVAHAQAAPNLNDLAIDWARGRYVSPVSCEIDGKTVNGVRRLLITPGSRDAPTASGRIVIPRMETESAARCFSLLGGAVPNITGQIDFYLVTSSHPETARRDLEQTLRREQGFDFTVREGQLHLEPIGKDGAAARSIELRGGHARLHLAPPGSDTLRVLAEIASPCKLLLELEAPNGERVSLPLALVGAR
jgi:hypothetical protein